MELKETNKPDYHHLISGDMSINTQCECVCNKGILKNKPLDVLNLLACSLFYYFLYAVLRHLSVPKQQ